MHCPAFVAALVEEAEEAFLDLGAGSSFARRPAAARDVESSSSEEEDDESDGDYDDDSGGDEAFDAAAAAAAAAFGGLSEEEVAALKLAAEIEVNAPLAVRSARDVVVKTQFADDEEAWEESTAAMMGLFQTEDFFEGPRAFIEKRAPRWTGKMRSNL